MQLLYSRLLILRTESLTTVLLLMIVNAKDRLLYCLMTDADYKVTLSDYYDIR